VPPGRYSLQLSVSDGTKNSGFVTHAVDATLHPAGQFRLGDLLLAPSAANDEGPYGVPAQVVIRERVIGGLEVTAQDSASLDDAVVRFEIVGAQGASALAPAAKELRSGGPLTQFVRTTLDVASLPPGDYVARASLVVRDTFLGAVDAPFRIAR
jgi:hypothetical protein